MLHIESVSKTFYKGTINEKTALDAVSLHMEPGDFVTVIGGNGAGKSTLLNSIAGVYPVDQGTIQIDGKDVTKMAEHQRAQFIGRVFQDPMLGTAAGMMLQENLALAARRGKKLGLSWGIDTTNQNVYAERLERLGLGLENRLTAKVGLLSGGQRQAITLLMAVLARPALLLLDEHTAALDPKTAEKVLDLTDSIVAENQLTTLMITHNMRDAIRLGNRLIMMEEGKIIIDVKGEEKRNLTVAKLLEAFEQVSHKTFDQDDALLSK